MPKKTEVAITERYRPETWEQIAGQTELIKRLKFLADSVNNGNSSMPNLLFHGPTGTGKTTTARIFCKAILKDEKPLILNASKDRGIDTIREQVTDYCKYRSMAEVPFKIIYLDEADRLTPQAQWALRAIMEDHTDVVRFILGCEEVTKIIPAIQGRCGKLRFVPVLWSDIYPYLKEVCISDKIKIRREALEEICKAANGNVREALNMLALVSQTQDGGILESDVNNLFGLRQDQICEILLKETKKDGDGRFYYEAIAGGMTPRGLFNYLVEKISASKLVSIPDKVKIINKVAEVDFRIVMGASPDIQVRSLLVFVKDVKM